MIDSAKLIDCCSDQRYFLQCSRHASRGLVVCRVGHVLITFVISLIKLRSSSSIIVSSDDYYNCLSWPSLAMRKLCYSGHLRCVPANLRGTNFLNKLRKGFELFLWHLTVDSTFHFLSFRVFLYQEWCHLTTYTTSWMPCVIMKVGFLFEKKWKKFEHPWIRIQPTRKLWMCHVRTAKSCQGCSTNIEKRFSSFPPKVYHYFQILTWLLTCVHTFQQTSQRSA